MDLCFSLCPHKSAYTLCGKIRCIREKQRTSQYKLESNSKNSHVSKSAMERQRMHVPVGSHAQQ